MYDIAIIGGGINGCGIARDLAGRGLSVVLVEKADLASGTSSASTKLVHGGLRYLEQYEFRLVRESLKEREVLWRAAPHIIWPLRFVLPHHEGLRPGWLIRLGLFLYDHIGGRGRLPTCTTVNLRNAPAGKALKLDYVTAFEYSDCWVDDARLVVANAQAARDLGADIRLRCEMTGARRHDGHWTLDTRDITTGRAATVEARVLVNAAGPWVGQVLTGRITHDHPNRTRLVKGSHIVVPRLFDHDKAYIFQHSDGRIVFAIPYEGAFTLIGTTDVDVGDDPDARTISADEIGYLCSAVSEYFAHPVRPEDVVWTYSGIRPLYDDGTSSAQEATRDYVLDLDLPEGSAALLNVFGGKITTFRRLSEEVAERLADLFPAMGPDWTRAAPLPGGDFSIDEVAAKRAALAADYPFLDAATVNRLVRSYGTFAWQVLGDATGPADLGEDFGAGLCQREVEYLIDREWAVTADDILWRRSKLGLHVDKAGQDRLAAWLAGRGST